MGVVGREGVVLSLGISIDGGRELCHASVFSEFGDGEPFGAGGRRLEGAGVDLGETALLAATGGRDVDDVHIWSELLDDPGRAVAWVEFWVDRTPVEVGDEDRLAGGVIGRPRAGFKVMVDSDLVLEVLGVAMSDTLAIAEGLDVAGDVVHVAEVGVGGGIKDVVVVFVEGQSVRVTEAGLVRGDAGSSVRRGVVGGLYVEEELADVPRVDAVVLAEDLLDVVLDGLIDFLGEAVGLRMVGCGKPMVDAEESAELVVDLVTEFRAVVRDDVLGDAEDSAVVQELFGHGVFGFVREEFEGEVFGERVDDDEDEGPCAGEGGNGAVEVELDDVVGAGRGADRPLRRRRGTTLVGGLFADAAIVDHVLDVGGEPRPPEAP